MGGGGKRETSHFFHRVFFFFFGFNYLVFNELGEELNKALVHEMENSPTMGKLVTQRTKHTHTKK